MAILQQGQNAPLGGFPTTLTVKWEKKLPDGLDIDANVYLLTSAGKVRGDDDMVFFGQRGSVEIGTTLTRSDREGASFTISKLPDGIEKAAMTVVMDDTAGTGRGFSHAGVLEIIAEGPQGTHTYSIDAAATGLAAVILAEVYVRNGEIKVRAVGQGFAGGLRPLSEHFGITVADDLDMPPISTPTSTVSSPKPSAPTIPPRPVAAPATQAPSPSAPALTPGVVLLEKKLVSLEKVRPDMVSLVKKSDQALSSVGLSKTKAKFYLCLDISLSMEPFYKRGMVDSLTERAMAMGFRLDDDGKIDVFLFGKQAHYYGQVGPADIDGFTRRVLSRHPYEYGTMYGLVMEQIRKHYRKDRDFKKIPAFVMFVTDGGTQDSQHTEKQILEASKEAIFWKFMAIGSMPKETGGKKGNRVSAEFEFLAHLDDMKGRLIDNADFFMVADPSAPTDEELYTMLLEEFPKWLENARKKRILRA